MTDIRPAPERFDHAVMRLTMLGPVELTGADPAVAAAIAAQPKRLALLAFVASRAAGEAVSRDRVLATFWPEQPSDRARGNLRNALYWLRGKLGAGVIVNRGNSLLIDAERMWCDAAELLAYRGDAAGDPARVLDLYRGEFLDGLHLSGAPDFERWVDRTRAALRARAVDLAWRLSAAAESAGEWITAARFGRRAADLAVDVEGATQRLIRLLDRAGDRGAALAEYDRLRSMLAAEFDIPPSPETAALVAGIRERREATTHRRPARPSDASESGVRARSLAVLPFADMGAGEASLLASGVGEDLLTALSRIRGVRVLSRTSVRRFANAPPTSIGEVRDLLGVDLVLEGSVQLAGNRVRITVQLIDAARDAHVWAESYDRRLTDVFDIQSDVALRVARSLEAELSPREHGRLRMAPTASIEAWRLYLKGREVWRRRDPGAAARASDLFRQALDIEDGFAQAWVGVADASMVRAFTGAGSFDALLETAKNALARALECDPELGEARATMGVFRTFFEPDAAGAEAEYRRAIEMSPGYANAHQWFGNWLCLYGRTREGLAELAAARDLDPLSPAIHESFGLGLYHAGRFDEAEAEYRRTIELDPDFWRALIDLALCRAHADDLPGAAQQLVAAWSVGAYGATPAEASAARSALERGPRHALVSLLSSVRARRGSARALYVAEVLLLVLLGRHAEATTTLAEAARAGTLGLVVMYAPLLDPLAENADLRQTFRDAGITVPRLIAPVRPT